MFLQSRDLHPLIQQRLHNLPNPMIPLQRCGILKRLPVVRKLHIRRIILEHHRLLGLEERIPDRQAVLDLLVKSPEHRMSFTNEELPARFQQARDDGRPLPDIGEPAYRSDACEDQIERSWGEDFESIVG